MTQPLGHVKSTVLFSNKMCHFKWLQDINKGYSYGFRITSSFTIKHVTKLKIPNCFLSSETGTTSNKGKKEI